MNDIKIMNARYNSYCLYLAIEENEQMKEMQKEFLSRFSQYPLDIYNKFVRILITMILPFAFVAYYPTMNYLGMDPYIIYIAPFIMIILWIIAIKVWNIALNKYRSTGT